MCIIIIVELIVRSPRIDCAISMFVNNCEPMQKLGEWLVKKADDIEKMVVYF